MRAIHFTVQNVPGERGGREGGWMGFFCDYLINNHPSSHKEEAEEMGLDRGRGAYLIPSMNLRKSVEISPVLLRAMELWRKQPCSAVKAKIRVIWTRKISRRRTLRCFWREDGEKRRREGRRNIWYIAMKWWLLRSYVSFLLVQGIVD